MLFLNDQINVGISDLQRTLSIDMANSTQQKETICSFQRTSVTTDRCDRLTDSTKLISLSNLKNNSPRNPNNCVSHTESEQRPLNSADCIEWEIILARREKEIERREIIVQQREDILKQFLILYELTTTQLDMLRSKGIGSMSVNSPKIEANSVSPILPNEVDKPECSTLNEAALSITNIICGSAKMMSETHTTPVHITHKNSSPSCTTKSDYGDISDHTYVPSRYSSSPSFVCDKSQPPPSPIQLVSPSKTFSIPPTPNKNQSNGLLCDTSCYSSIQLFEARKQRKFVSNIDGELCHEKKESIITVVMDSDNDILPEKFQLRKRKKSFDRPHESSAEKNNNSVCNLPLLVSSFPERPSFHDVEHEVVISVPGSTANYESKLNLASDTFAEQNAKSSDISSSIPLNTSKSFKDLVKEEKEKSNWLTNHLFDISMMQADLQLIGGGDGGNNTSRRRHSHNTSTTNLKKSE
eukprot:Tbor_TRINITY_DN6019_c1_g1::TRINITY_DN6019_c1_g1_i1::g.11234::m.11234